MIYLDPREGGSTNSPRQSSPGGSDEILRLLLSHRSRPAASIKTLPAADFAFSGHGERGVSMIGIERKRLKDMLSSLRTQRVTGEQIPGLWDYYEYPFIILEGHFRISWTSGYLEEPAGNFWRPVEIGQQRFLGLELQSRLSDIISKARIPVIRTFSLHETLEWVIALHHAFSKPWEKRHYHEGIYFPPSPHATLGKASTVRRVAACLGGVGWERSGAVANQFSSVAAMVEAQPSDWSKVPGIGAKLSVRIHQELHGQYDSGDGFE